MVRGAGAALLLAGALCLAACSSDNSSGATRSTAASSPPTASATPTTKSSTSTGPPSTIMSASSRAEPGHVVVVVLENHSYADIVGNPAAPYLNSLARRGMSLTDMHAITHPSQPNYLAMFAGSTQGSTDDSCPLSFAGPSLAGELLAAGRTFTGYSEDLPSTGSTACSAGPYARKHAPWVDFRTLPARVNQAFTAFPRDFATLPTVSFVVPNLDNDMHDGTIGQADAWVRRHLDGYARWAAVHGSLLVVTWDEDDRSGDNHIATFVVGARVPAKQVTTRVTLYSLLRMIEDRYRLHRLGLSATAAAMPLA